MGEIQFMLVEPAPGVQSRRDRELQDSLARSHASRVSHARAKNKPKRPSSPRESHHEDCEWCSKRILQPQNQRMRANRNNHHSHTHLSPDKADSNTNDGYSDLSKQLIRRKSPLSIILAQTKRDPFDSYGGSTLPSKLMTVLEDGEQYLPCATYSMPQIPEDSASTTPTNQ